MKTRWRNVAWAVWCFGYAGLMFAHALGAVSLPRWCLVALGVAMMAVGLVTLVKRPDVKPHTDVT